MERATVQQEGRIVAETTPGTAPGSGYKILRALSFEPSVQAEATPIRPVGQKFPTTVPPIREWTAGRVSGIASYSDLTYIFSSLLKKVTPTQPDPSGAPTARQWSFTPSQAAEDTIQTYTIYQGDSDTAHKASYVLFPSATLRFTRTGNPEVTADMLGQRLSSGVSLPSGAAVVPKPILAPQVSVYLDPTPGGIGTTKLTRVFEVSVSIENRFGPVWVLDSAQNSWVAHIPLAPTARITLLMEANQSGMGFLDQMRANTTKYLRISCIGPTIGGTITYKLNMDFAVQVAAVSEFRDQDGVYAVEWTLESIYDDTSGWAKTFTVDLVNEIAAL